MPSNTQVAEFCVCRWANAIVLTLCCCVWVSLAQAQAPPVLGYRPDSRPVTSLAGGNAPTKAVVLFFVASDCPISNRTFPEMKRVREKYLKLGVRFWFVYSNHGEQPTAVQAHQRAFDVDGEAILDRSGELARLAGARVTPEVGVLVAAPSPSGWAPVYTGRIDDRYVRLGLERPAATQHFAERVIEEVLHGEPVERATGSPVGCAIMRASK